MTTYSLWTQRIFFSQICLLQAFMKKTGKKKLIIEHLKKIYYLNRSEGSNLLGDYYPLAKSITASKPGLDLSEADDIPCHPIL